MAHIHILGICGTFMGSLAQLAKALGHTVTGSDANVYPPMSTQLEAAGIQLYQGYDPEQLQPEPDVVVIGNAMSRGNPAVEAVLNRGIAYTSGPQWLADYVLPNHWVLAVSGTHGKTTTASMLAWILDYAGMHPGYLIGGVPSNFSTSARLGKNPFFVVEADEYDSAFFDKRSKFVHYRPRTLVINNLEFDHADIFANLEAIQTQFHHVVRTVPSNGFVLTPANTRAISEVINQGCWSTQQQWSIDKKQTALDIKNCDENNQENHEWRAQLQQKDGTHFSVFLKSDNVGSVQWPLTGDHNVNNAMAAIAAARTVGVTADIACEALSQFAGVKRRMECIYNQNGIHVYDDFAHHPTAITTTLEGLRRRVGKEKIIALIEPRSNTMRLGCHQQQLANTCLAADVAIWYEPEGMNWSLDEVIQHSSVAAKKVNTIEQAIESVKALLAEGESCHVVIMSNGGFSGVHQRLISVLQ